MTNSCGDLQSLADRAVALGPEHGRTKELMGWAVCEIERLRERLRIARNIIVDAQNFIHPTTVWRDTDLMQRNIDRFLADGRTSEPSESHPLIREGWFRFNEGWHPIQRFRLVPGEDEAEAVQNCFPGQRIELRGSVKSNPPRELTLQDFGYAPGNYAIKCLDCGQEALWCDKRAARCETCAKQALAENRKGLAVRTNV